MVVDGFQSKEMQHGTDTEPQARAAYEFLTDAEVVEDGFVLHPIIADFGASPDGLIGDVGLLEIKCPNTAAHIETLLTGEVPGKYVTQMQAQMAELQLRQLMAEVAKLEAEAAKLEADGQLSGAKAQVAIAGENRATQAEQFNQQFDQHKLRADMAKAAANLMNKLQLAGVHVQAKEGLTRYTTQSKLMDAHMERGNKIELAKLKPKPAPKPAAPKKKAAAR